MSNTSQQLPNVEENSTQLLNDIQSLQSIEQQLFNSLEENTGLKFNKTPQEHSSVLNSELFSIISYYSY